MATEQATVQQQQTGEKSSEALRLFREAYFTFMDASQRIWSSNCQELGELSATASVRFTKAAQNNAVEEANAAGAEFSKERQRRADKAIAELKTTFQRYVQASAAAWTKASADGVDESTLGHVGVGQMNVAWTYSSLLAALRC